MSGARKAHHWTIAENDSELMGMVGGQPVKSERALVAAVLCRAMMDLLNTYTREDRTSVGGTKPWLRRIEAAQWVAQNQPDEPFSFRWCCDVLGIEPASIRRWAQEVREDQRDRRRFRGQKNLAKIVDATRLYAKRRG